jgi:RimJ/RimL family protein N-acetyltransferase
MEADITEMSIADYDEVFALWQATENIGLHADWCDSRAGIARYLARNPGTCFVARAEGKLVGAVLCGHEGRRGYMNHLAVGPAWRRRGLGTTLVRRCTDALKAAGIAKCNLFVLSGNTGAIAFYRKLGWRRWDELNVTAMTFGIGTPEGEKATDAQGASQPPRQDDAGIPTLRTERLVLRPFALSDAAEVQRQAGVREVASPTLNIPHPYADGVAEKWIATHPDEWRDKGNLHLAITLADGGTLVGAIGLANNKEHRRAEIGYWIGVEQWGKGYCTEAARAVVRFGFERMGLNSVRGRHMSRNPASGAVMRKCGMTHEGTLRQEAMKWDRFEDMEVYSVLREEYVAAQQHPGDSRA